MSQNIPNTNVALLIDGDNAQPSALDPVLTVLAELGTVNIRRVYGNWRKQSLKTWADLTLKHGIEPHQQFDLTKGKNATDMKMTIDAMDLLYTRRVDAFGIMSSDADFMPLALRIKQDGIPVYGFGTMRAPEPFRQACTRFIDVVALAQVRNDEVAAVREAGSGRPAEPGARVAVRGRDAGADVDAGAGAEEATGTPQRAEALDDELIKLLIGAYNAAKHDENGFVGLSELGRLAGNRSSFDTRNYGFRRLSDMFEKIPNFQIKRQNGHVLVKRLR